MPSGVKKTPAALFDELESSVFPESKSIPCGSSMQGSRKSVKRRSSLFDALPSSRSRNDKTASTFGEEQLESTIVLDSQLTSDSALRPRKKSMESECQRQKERQESLFGAVMNRSELLEPTATPTTPMKCKSEKSNLYNEIGNSVMSPTGKTIMGFVKNFGDDSPFRFQSPKKRALEHRQSTTQSNFNPREQIVSKKPEWREVRQNKTDQDWWEIPIVRDQLACLDFSLRTTISIECNLNFCLRSVIEQDIVQKHLTYWIYPCMALDSLSVFPSQTKDIHGTSFEADRFRNAKQEVMGMSSKLGKTLTDLVRGDKALYSSKSLGRSQRKLSSNRLKDERRWQEAFRSIFLKWCRSIQSLLNKEEIRRSACDIYFYCLAKDHVVIFRVEEIVDDHSNSTFEPRAIISNVSSEFLMKRELEGVVDIQFLNEPSWEENERSATHRKESSAPMSPNLKAELEALRRAQALGENAGADVRVKPQKRHVKERSTSHETTNCGIFGFDNVASFFEVYLNSCGGISATNSQKQQLPLLMCDKGTGPFLHATFESLKPCPIKTTGAQSVRLEGIVMPSALRNIVGILSREAAKGGECAQLKHNRLEEEGVVGYMIIETAIQEELSLVSKGLKNSRSFNWWNTRDESVVPQTAANGALMTCATGRCIKRMVWEVSSPKVLACNFE